MGELSVDSVELINHMVRSMPVVIPVFTVVILVLKVISKIKIGESPNFFNRYESRIVNYKNDYEKSIMSYDNYIKALEQEIEEIQAKIEDSKRYLGLDEKYISSELFAVRCSDFGVNQRIEATCFSCKQVFSSSLDSGWANCPKCGTSRFPLLIGISTRRSLSAPSLRELE